MVDLALLNFILYNFLQAGIRSAVIFNCWNVETQLSFSHRANQEFMFMQYVRLDESGSLDNYRHRYFDHNQPTIGVFLDFNCDRAEGLLNLSSREQLFTFHQHWLVYDEKANLRRFRSLFINANLSIDADLTYVRRVATSTMTAVKTLELISESPFESISESASKLTSKLTIDSTSNSTSETYLEPTSESSFETKVESTSESTSESLSESTFESPSKALALVPLTPQLPPAPGSSPPPHGSFVLYDVYNNAHYLGGHLNITIDRVVVCNASACRVDRFLSELHLRSKYGNRCSLKDITMRTGVVVTAMPITRSPEELFAFLVSLDNPISDGLVRYGFNLLLMLFDSLDCNSQLLYMNRWSVGESSGGSIGAMIAGQVDLLATPILLISARLKHLSVLIETGQIKTTCMFRTPRNTGIKTGVFLEPFSATVWLIFLLVLFVCAVLLWSTFFVERHRLQRRLGHAPSLLTAALIAFGSACSQGTSLVPGSIGGRMAFFSLSLVSFLMYNYYTSMVVSSLLGSPVKSNIRSLGQLADSPLEVAIEPIPYSVVYLNTSLLPEVQRFVQRKIKSRRNPQDVWMSAEEGVRRVRDQRGFVFIFEGTTGYRLVERTYEPHEICDLNEFPLRSEKGLYIQLHRNSSFKELVRLKHMRMLETGLVQKQLQYWVRLKLHCFDNNFVVDVGLEYTAPLFLLMIIFYGFCLVVLVLEIVYHRLGERRKKNTVVVRGEEEFVVEGEVLGDETAIESILNIWIKNAEKPFIGRRELKWNERELKKN